MSELKTFDSQRIYWAVEQVERVAGDIAEVHLDDNLFYLKSEADKVIKKLNERVSEEREAKVNYKISACDLSGGLRDAYDEIRHHKFKRCLKNAENCDNRARYYFYYYYYFATYRKAKTRKMWKWRQRWLDLAKTFQP